MMTDDQKVAAISAGIAFVASGVMAECGLWWLTGTFGIMAIFLWANSLFGAPK